MFASFTQQTVYGEIGINTVIGGSGDPVLLLHGYPQNLAMWARVAPALAADHTVVCTDLRGYGDSDKPAQGPDLANYSFRSMAQDQVDVMHALGFDRFHVIGHDRGARTAHRMALDHPSAVRSLALLDIVPTYDMFDRVDAMTARAYWHWYFLQQPAPFPEEIIAADPDHFFEECLVGWGAMRLSDFDPEQLDAYRRTWRQRESIFAGCADYRATAEVDVRLDEADLHRTVDCPALVVWGERGIARLFDMEEIWSARLTNMQTASLPSGHFFVDEMPDETTTILRDFLAGAER
ncbi:alpha/beta fold hydrolase [Aeromicrobium ginsengisoli]|uniref:Alpha/beta hydrolase n=1 Tax=Aeromicrobium ginsengisoli TaxID=363867 RepID=A0A5M4FG80_9ACTN|nr:alpha/beta hydrolase [Aeromicrobium ginsengisoli]KAA1397793.1 alpha/beta hydrolase [Aeromicrobium ginsengisoli]